MIQFCFQEMSCEWIKQEALEENEIKFEAGLKKEIPLDVERTHSVTVEDGEIPHKLKKEYSSKSISHFEVNLIQLPPFNSPVHFMRVVVGVFLSNLFFGVVCF